MSHDAARLGKLPAENRDNTIARGCHGAGVPISLTIGRVIRASEYPIDLACRDKIVLVQSLDFLGSQRDGRVAPAKLISG